MKLILSILKSVLILSIPTFISYYIGYNKGFDNGANSALDICNEIVQKQIHSDSTITKLTIITPKDTNTYILQSKTLSK